MPFRPSRLPEIPAHKYELYGEVRSRVCRFHDRML